MKNHKSQASRRNISVFSQWQEYRMKGMVRMVKAKDIEFSVLCNYGTGYTVAIFRIVL